MAEKNQIKPGNTYTRDQVAAVFGGQTYSGIAPSNTTPSVILYSDPAAGKKFDYHDDLEAEDEYGPLVLYTGEGQPRHGDQQMTKGNKAILNHKEDKRALHLFAAAGKVPGTGTKIHEYLGEYEVDPVLPYFKHEARGEHRTKRSVLMFRLRPVGEVAPPPIDYISVAEKTEVIELHPGLPSPAAKESSSRLMEPEKHTASVIVRTGTSPVTVSRRESDLVQRYIEFLKLRGKQVKRLGLTIKDLPGIFPTDLFEVGARVLYEAKGVADRNSIRLAIGQLFDYRRHVKPEPKALAILLPEAPNEDLRNLIESVGISLVYEDNGEFIGWPVNGGSTEV
jgi:5-methylcytosine-specific restriction protein A